MHFFGWIGFISGFGGFSIVTLLLARKLYFGVVGGFEAFKTYDIGSRPSFLLGILAIILGVQFLVTGIIAELVVRTYYESQSKTVYQIRELVGKGPNTPEPRL